MSRCNLALAGLVVSTAACAFAQSGPSEHPGAVPFGVCANRKQVLELWNVVGKRLIEAAEDFPEDKYSVQWREDGRTFGGTLVDAADEDYRLLTTIKGAPMGPAGGNRLNTDDYKNKAAVVALVKQVFADGAALLKEQGIAGFSRRVNYPDASHKVRVSHAWLEAIYGSLEHYRELPIYYYVAGRCFPHSLRGCSDLTVH